jgi:hypothetical protein
MRPSSPNLGFLQAHDPLLVRLAGFAEAYAPTHPNAAQAFGGITSEAVHLLKVLERIRAERAASTPNRSRSTRKPKSRA